MSKGRGGSGRFNRQLMLGVSVAAMLAPAAALANGPARGWQGAYAGLHAGYGWGDSDVACTSGICTLDGSFDTRGAFAGGQLGYNWQMAGFLVGVEGDFSFSGIDGDAFFGGKNVESDLDWMATVRGRAGAFVSEGVLLYGTAGIAWGDWNDRATIISNHRWSSVYTGFTVGGGLEAAINRNMTVKLEYQFLDFGDESHTWTSGGNSGRVEFDHQVHTVRLGVNFKLN